jgi:hypothetical protein
MSAKVTPAAKVEKATAQTRQQDTATGEHTEQYGNEGGGTGLLRMQRLHGNRFVQRFIQAKIEVSQPGDPYEQKASKITQRFMTTPDTCVTRLVQQTPTQGDEKTKKPAQSIVLQVNPSPRTKKPAADEEEEGKACEAIMFRVLHHEAPNGFLPQAKESVGATAATSNSVGQSWPVKPLLGNSHRKSERAFVDDLIAANMHTEPRSVEPSKAISAPTRVSSPDINFDQSQYNRERPDDQRVHLVQQGKCAPQLQQPPLAHLPQRKADFSGNYAGEAVAENKAATVTTVAVHRKVVARNGIPGDDSTKDKESKGTWNPTHFYEDDGLVAATDYYQADNNLEMITLTLSPLVKGGIPMAQLMTSRVDAKRKSLPKDGALSPEDASDLQNIGNAALMAYFAGVQQMKETLTKSLSQYKEPEGMGEAQKHVAEMLHDAFSEDESMLTKAKDASEKLHIAEENIHHMIEWAETSIKEVTMIQHWYVTPHESSFEHIIEGGGKIVEWAAVVHGAVQAVWACASAISTAHDSSKSSAQKGAAGIEAGTAVVSAGLGVGAVAGIAGAAGLGLIWADTVIPETQACLNALEHLDKLCSSVARENERAWWEEVVNKGGGPPTIPKQYLEQGTNWFPGGQATLNYMWAVFQGEAPEQAPASVIKFFYDNRKKMNAEHGEGDQLETEWHLFKANEVKNLNQWVVEHKVEVWGLLYGGLPHPGGGG